MRTIWNKYQQFRPFTDSEAWAVFRLAAISEAVGWTLLGSGILSKRLLLHGNDTPVIIAGRIHGTLFLLYIAAVVLVAPSLRWQWWRICLAGIASIPPYGSIIYESIENSLRKQSHRRTLVRTLQFKLLLQSGP